MHPARLSGSLLLLALSTPATIQDNFDQPLDSSRWTASVGLSGGQVSSPVADSQATDGYALELLYPGKSSGRKYGPHYASQVERVVPTGYGTYQARLKTATVNSKAGMVSAFFTYFNDGSDADQDGMADNSEIDFEFVAAEPSVIYVTIWTDYDVINGVETFYHTAHKVDLATGRVWQTEPGYENAYGHLVEGAPLGWSIPGFDASTAFRTYGFQWESNRIQYWIDLEDGKGKRLLWDFKGQPDVNIPSRPAYAMFNLWHNNYAWDSNQPAPPPTQASRFRVDWAIVP